MASKITWLIVLGIILLVGILVYGVFLLKDLDKDQDLQFTIPILSNETEFISGEPEEVDEKAQESFEEAKSKIFAKTRSGTNLKNLGNLAEWLSLILGSAITILAGIYGRKVTPESVSALTVEEVLDDSNRTKSKTRLIGLLLAIVVVVNSLGNQVERRGLKLHEASDLDLDKVIELAKSYSETQRLIDKEEILARLEIIIEKL